VPVLWLARGALANCGRPWEKIGPCVAHLLPLEARVLQLKLGLPLTPLVLAGSWPWSLRAPWHAPLPPIPAARASA
jgi:hypothetical protein